MTLLGVYREKVFSPGKVLEDAAILDATLRALSRSGYAFHTIEAEALTSLSGYSHILTMAQSERALEILEAQQARGAKIINSVASVRNSYRKPLIRLLGDAGLPTPRSEIVPTGELEGRAFSRGADSCWLKRGDVHAVEAGDVVRAGSAQELAAAIRHFKERRIVDVLVQEHIEGEVIKFYGVAAGNYFRAFLASTGEEITSAAGKLRELARRAAAAVGLEIYGGDAVVTPKRHAVLIDINDWPSFSRCRESAAESISRYIAGVIDGSDGPPQRRS